MSPSREPFISGPHLLPRDARTPGRTESSGLCPEQQLESRALRRRRIPDRPQGPLLSPRRRRSPRPPGLPRAAIPARPGGKEATGRGRRGAHLRRRGALGAGRRRGGGGGHVVQRRRRAAPSRNSALPSPPCRSGPQTWDFSEKSSRRLRNARLVRRLLPSAASPATARCPPEPVRGGRAPLR